MTENIKCCFIGHRKIVKSDELKIKLKCVLKELIETQYIREFLFGSRSEFDEFALQIVSELKKEYNEIIRVYVRAEYENISEEYRNYLLKSYDSTYMPEKIKGAGRASYVERNRIMIEDSNFAIFYYDTNVELKNYKIGTKIAYDYAMKRKNLNIFEDIKY